MKAVSPTCRELATANLSQFPDRYVFKEGQATYEAIQEVFWACMVEVVDSLLGAPAFPDTIRIGREQVIVSVQDHHWLALRAELGLDRSGLRELVKEVLDTHLRHQPVKRSPLLPAEATLADRCSVRLLGLVLFTCYLDELAFSGPPKQFGYEFREMTHLARGCLDWVPVGKFDEGRVAREFCEYAAMRIQASDRLLRIPYYAFYRPLRGRLHSSGESAVEPPPPAVPQLPRDFLVRSLPESGPGVDDHRGSVVPDDMHISNAEKELLDELNRLRTENDRLRKQWAGDALADILSPLLDIAGSPVQIVEDALRSCPVLVRDLLYGLLKVLRSQDLEFIGEPGQVLELHLPNVDYRLDEALPPMRQDVSIGRFRVRRRGLRLKGVLLLPVKVYPVEDC